MRKTSHCGVLIPFALWMVLAGCSSDDNKSSGGGANCTDVCAKADALHCTNDTPGKCATDCQQLSMTATCKAEWDALMACSATATYACTADGEAKVQGCDTQTTAYFTCLLGGLDGGTD